jgi:hypothetical protein
MRALFVMALCGAMSSAMGQSRTFQDWGVVDATDKSGDAVAYTYAAGEMFAVRCFVKTATCLHILRSTTPCPKDASIPLLMSGRRMSAHVIGECSDQSELYLSTFDDVRKTIDESGPLFGIAIPLDDAVFKAVRFSTKGSKAAMDEAERRVRQRASTKPGVTEL